LSWENDGDAMTNPSDPIEVEAIVVYLATEKLVQPLCEPAMTPWGAEGQVF
jgi:hypothetical protein